MKLQLFNTFGRKKQIFEPLNPDCVTMYSCGPTIYNRPHIGNLSSFLTADLLKRYLIWSGYNVKNVMNLTDVDDKIIKGLEKSNLSLGEYTDQFAEQFFADLRSLEISPANYYPRATEYIDQMIEIIKILLENGHAYKNLDGSIYYRISSFSEYGKLALLKNQSLVLGARINSDEYKKEEANDFALWKAWTEKDGDVFWETELGKGRPGWHIECSAMSTSILGPTIDIHTGAVDLIFPHHTNEIAQSEAATGKQFVRYWCHRSHLKMGDEKMSKSLNNVVNLDEILNLGFQPLDFRFFILSNHYRSTIVYTKKALEAAKASRKKIKDFVWRLKGIENEATKIDIEVSLKEARSNFKKEMDDDLGVSKAMAVIFLFIKKINSLIDQNEISKKDAESILSFIYEIDSVFCFLDKETPILESKEVLNLVEQRSIARANKNFAVADEIRQKLISMGIDVRDDSSGTKITLIN